MSEHITFVERVLNGDVIDLEEIDDDIDAWHESPQECSLAEWLGLTQEEYGLFVEQPESLRVIIKGL